VSLLFHERTIRRAVAGELSAPAEELLRAHLRRCPVCLARYEALSRAAAVLAGAAAGVSSRVRSQRDRARLVAALSSPSPSASPAPLTSPMPRGTPQPRHWRAWTVLVLAPVAALAAVWIGGPMSMSARKSPPSQPVAPQTSQTSRTPQAPQDVQWRGAGDDAPDGRGSLVIYAAQKQPGGGAGALRIVTELPGSGQGRVSLSEYVAFGVRDLPSPAFVTVAGVQDDGTIHIYLPRPAGDSVHALAGPDPTVFRPSIDLAAAHRTGRLVIHALFSRSPLAPDQVRRALVDGARSVASDPSTIQIGGVLIIEP
jgi:hypothetical protein